MTTTVLLADDHNVMREGLRRLLEGTDGIRVVGDVADGRDAVRVAKENCPDVVVMDVTMPGLNGVEATRQIRAALPKTKVLALSMHTDGQFVTEMLKAGASGYLLKTCVVDEQELAIRAVNSGKVYLGPEIGPVLAEIYIGKSAGTDAPGVSLTRRQREILQLIAEGLTTKQIARQLARSAKTIEMHRRHLMEKLNLHGVADLTKYAIRRGLTSLDA